jgi:hypothetical protein
MFSPAWKRGEPFAGLTAFPNRIYPIVKIFFDTCQNSRTIAPAIGSADASKVQLRLRAGRPSDATLQRRGYARRRERADPWRTALRGSYQYVQEKPGSMGLDEGLGSSRPS